MEVSTPVQDCRSIPAKSSPHESGVEGIFSTSHQELEVAEPILLTWSFLVCTEDSNFGESSPQASMAKGMTIITLYAFPSRR